MSVFRAMGQFFFGTAGNARHRPAAMADGLAVGEGLPQAVAELLRGGSRAEQALSISAVHRAVSLISGAVGSMPIQVRRRAGAARHDASDHWAGTLLRRQPNAWQTPQQFKRLMQTHLLLRGNAYALKVGDSRRVSQLIPLEPDRVEVRQRDDWQLEYVYTSKKRGRVVLPQDEIMHLVGLSLDGVTGLSVLSLAAATIGQALAVQRHGTAVFANATRLGGILTHPKTLSQEAIAHLRESLDDFRGAENAGKSIILEEGMTFAQMAMTLEDAQFVETAGLTRSEIYQFFGLPPHMAGDTEKATSWGTGIEAMSLGFVNYTLNDWLVTWEEAIARDLLVKDPDIYVQFNRNALVRGDIRTRWASYAQARQWAVLTGNEIRELEDMAPLEGLDDPFIGGNGQRAGADGSGTGPGTGES